MICTLLAIWLAAVDVALGISTSLPERAGAAPVRTLAVEPDRAGVRKTADLPFLLGRLCVLEKRLFADAADGRLDEFSPLAAALIASGLEDTAALDRYRQQKDALLDELRRSGKLTGSARRRAQAIFEFMHRRVLQSGYRTDCTDLRAALDQEGFNCVSASVLFNCLAGELGLAVCGLEIPGHAMSRLLLCDGPLDIETTCPQWFQLLDDPQKQAELVQKATGRAPSADRSRAREVSGTQMTAMIYYNRGVDLLAAKRFEQAATANAKAVWLDPQSVTAWGNLLATINNWAIDSGSSQRYAEAVGLLSEGLRLDPTYETFVLNYVYVHHQWVDHLCRSGQYEEALDVLDRAGAEMPDREYFHQAAADVYRLWVSARPMEREPAGASASFVRGENRRDTPRWPLTTETRGDLR